MERLTSVENISSQREQLLFSFLWGKKRKKKSQTWESVDYFPSPQDQPSVPNSPTSVSKDISCSTVTPLWHPDGRKSENQTERSFTSALHTSSCCLCSRILVKASTFASLLMPPCVIFRRSRRPDCFVKCLMSHLQRASRYWCIPVVKVHNPSSTTARRSYGLILGRRCSPAPSATTIIWAPRREKAASFCGCGFGSFVKLQQCRGKPPGGRGMF